MLWLIIGVPIIFVQFFRVFFYGSMASNWHPWDFMDYFMNGMMVFLLTAVATMFLSAVPFGLGFLFSTEKQVAWKRRLVAVRDKDGVAGQFYLGSGMIENAPYYLYYFKHTDGSVSPGKVEISDGVRVYEDAEPDKAVLLRYEWRLKAEWAYLVAFPQDDYSFAYEFHVPRNTVRVGFSM